MSGPVLAVLGGGQLGRMLALAAARLGVRCRFMDEAPDAVAGDVGEVITDTLSAPRRLDELLAGVSAVTYEFENVPGLLADQIAARGLSVWPPPRALRTSQDRLLEKRMFVELDIGTPAFAPAASLPELREALARVGLPAVVKTRRFGYDGKGQAVIRSEAQIQPAFELLSRGVPGSHAPADSPVLLIAEGLVKFRRELSVLIARGVSGASCVYPLTQNHHEGGILRTSVAPAEGVSPELAREGERIARAVADHLGYVGVLAVELFEVDGRLLASEIAPRVHNSGHWTMDGAATDQFEQHVRAVMGWPLGEPSARGHAGMVNLIGSHPPAERLLAIPGAHVHLYGKTSRPGRKLGHVNVVAPTAEERDAAMRRVLSEINR